MSVLFSKDQNELIVSCKCGCDDSIRIKLEKDSDIYSYISYLNGNFYKEQYGAFNAIKAKIKKIWRIIRNKDYCYSDIVMTPDDWQEFKKWVNEQ